MEIENREPKIYTVSMSYIIVGLGNPGEQYLFTRHNTGRLILEQIKKVNNFEDWQEDRKNQSLTSSGKISKEKVLLVEPETFMNKSGNALKKLINSEKKAKTLIVIHDDLDIPFGSFKIVFNRGSGGHRGVESVIRAIKTEAFIRIKTGISPSTPSGKIKKPKGGQAVEKLILGEFKKPELDSLKKISKKITEAVEMIIGEGLYKAMTDFN